MTTSLTKLGLLLVSTALIAPAVLAQTSPPPAVPGGPPPTIITGDEAIAETIDSATPGAADTLTDDVEADDLDDLDTDSTMPDISGPGAGSEDDLIIVQGRNIPDPIRATPEVVSVLTAEDIARTGDGDIAAALGRVTGLSLVGGRFVYVRGLGERYSLALLNGSPLPSPEPLRRVVPLDIFPTSIIASSVVQKSYSVAYPGEFGGGVINLTTAAIPDESFITVGGSVSGNTETTGELGYTYFGSDSDFTGFDDGARTNPAIFQDALDSGNVITPGPDFTLEELEDITASLLNAPTTLVQRNNDIPVNGSFEITGGHVVDIGSDRLGVIANFGWKNGWQTKGGLQQFVTGLSTNAEGEDALIPELGQDFEFLSTENRIVVNGLIGFGYEFGEHKARWTSLYIRDTLKEARIQAGTDQISVGPDLLNRSFTNWFERQLIDTQGVVELEFGDFSLDLRGTYAETQRESPYERAFSYRFEEDVNDFVNDLRTNGERASVAFSDLDEDIYSGAFDVAYDLPIDVPVILSAGFAYSDQQRTATRRDFVYRPESALPLTVEQARPDFLLSDVAIRTFDIVLNDLSSQFGTAAYDAGLEIFGGYGQIEVEPFDFVRAVFGVRYEDSSQFVEPLAIFGVGPDVGDIASTSIDATEFLPAATITWNPLDDLQVRLSASRTLARPQFRELAPQQFFDSESDRTFVGNEFLTNSDLINVEARAEYYLGRDERISVAGFYKDLDNPIETIATTQGQTFFVTFANAPEAQLFGAEVELQKYFPLYDVFEGVFGDESTFFETRDLVLVANYTYTDSEIGTGAADALTTLGGTGGVPTLASNVFVDGEPLTGQSDHLVNVQLSLEDSETLSQQTLLLNYASSRITNRFTSTTVTGDLASIPFREIPGVDLDFIARQGIELGGVVAELKFEARNLLDTRFQEIQTFNGSRVDLNTYDRGRTFALGVGVTF